MTQTPSSAGSENDRTGTRTSSPWWIVLVLLAGFGLMVARRPDGASGLWMWAEDGTIFVQGAYGGDFSLVFEPYAGQWWPLMRLVAEPISHLPAEWWPLAAYLVAGLVAALAMGVVLQERAANLLGPLPLRIALYFVLLLQPIVWEIQGNLTNAHVWVASGLLVILVLPPPRTKWGKGTEMAFILLGCLTGLLGTLLLPAAIWCAVRERGAYQWSRLAIVTGAAVVNVLLQWPVRQPSAGSILDYAGSAAILIVKRFAGGLFLGDKGQLDYWYPNLLSPFIIPSLLILVGIAFLVGRDIKGPSPIWLFCGLLWMGLGLTVAVNASIEGLSYPFTVGRYVDFAVGATLLVIFRALALPARSGRWVAAALLVAMSYSLVTGFFMTNEPTVASPRMDRAQLDAFGECVDQGAYPCQLPIAPPGWSIVIEQPQ